MVGQAVETMGRTITVVVVLVLLLSLVVGPAAAQSVAETTGAIVVGQDETVERVDGVAGSIIIRGTVTDDVSGVAGTVHVTESGTVGGDVSAAAGTLRIDGRVGGDVSAGAGSIEVGDTAAIGGSLDAGAGYIGIDGSVDGSVTAGADTIVLGPNAAVGGEFRYDANAFERDPGASIGGQVVRDESVSSGSDGLAVPGWVGPLYGLLANLLLGVVLLALFPTFSGRVAETVTGSPARAGGLGLAVLLLTPILLVLIAITVVGIPISVAGLVVFGLAIWVAVVYGQFAVGRWVLRQADVTNRWAALLVGVTGVALVGLVPILGGLLDLLVLLVGIGALSIALWSSYRGRRGAGADPAAGGASPT